MTERLVNGRFTVTMSGVALQAAKAARINLSALTARALGHINALLPGPKTTITVGHARPGGLIPQQGVAGYTNPFTGHITAAFGTTPESSITRTLTFGFPRDLAGEVNHSVRILTGPGFGPTLLPQIISEGIATAFDQAAFPGPPDPWADAITPTQECALWKKAKPQLDETGLYNLWMFGGAGILHWIAFTIGYHIVSDYRSHHPNATWAALTSTSATAILAGSHYQPCRTNANSGSQLRAAGNRAAIRAAAARYNLGRTRTDLTESSQLEPRTQTGSDGLDSDRALNPQVPRTIWLAAASGPGLGSRDGP